MDNSTDVEDMQIDNTVLQQCDSRELPAGFRLTKFGKLTSKSFVVPKEFYEKWIPENDNSKSKPQQTVLFEITEGALKEWIPECQNVNSKMQQTVVVELGEQHLKEVIVRDKTVLSETSISEQKICNLIYPIVDDPTKSGKIACAALLSKLFIIGIYECENIVFMIGVCNKWSNQEREVVKLLVMEGFQSIAAQINAKVEDIIFFTSRFCMFGGFIEAAIKNLPYDNTNVAVGDVLVLTKPLGAQLAIEAFKVLQGEQTERRVRLVSHISDEDIRKAYNDALQLMTTLNLRSSMLAGNYEVRALIEINGKSLIEHAQELAEQQTNEVSLNFYNLPLIAKVATLGKILSKHNELIQGNLPEVSGGLLLVMQREQAADFCKSFNNGPDHAWIIGVAESGDRKANINKKPRIIEWLNR